MNKIIAQEEKTIEEKTIIDSGIDPEDIFHLQFDSDLQFEILESRKFGPQFVVAMEKCAELQKAISQLVCFELESKNDDNLKSLETSYKEYKQLIANLTEEMGDVITCIFRLMIRYGIENTDIQKVIKYKEAQDNKRYYLEDF